ncbi:ferredoxin-type protein NapF [Pseudomonas paraeruginosa]|uniref:ferredoxin-type protein NapF n=1 Tax=Pseudomonas paraeruginosa TaxID=2994495 RepID=UPI0034D61F97
MPTRRELFGRLGGRPPTRRPPWTAADFAARCTGCAACVEACPEAVLRIGAGRLAELDLSAAGCSLCGECAQACRAGLIGTGGRAFPWVAAIGEDCLALAGIHCRSCQDACEPAAIRFRPAPGGVALAELDSQRCNGCGACLAPCPSQAIQLRALSTEESPRHA